MSYCQASESSVTQKRYFIDGSGQKIRMLRVDFGVATSNILEIVSRGYYLKLIDDGHDDDGQQVSVSGGNCRIGGDQVASSSLKILLNNKFSLSTSEAKSGINLVVKIENPNGRLGIVHCDGFDFIIR